MSTPWNSSPKRGAMSQEVLLCTGELSRRPETTRMVVWSVTESPEVLGWRHPRREPQGLRDLTENRADTDKGVRRLVSCESDTVLCPG